MTDLRSLREKLILRAKEAVQSRYSEPDAHIVRAVNALDDLDQIINLLFEQVREWYGVAFPELERVEKNPDAYFDLVVRVGARENFLADLPSNLSEEKRVALSKAASVSMGSPVSASQLSAVQALARLGLSLKAERVSLQSFVEAETTRSYPVTSGLVSALLAARLITRAGGAKNLAFMPSGTIQTLGAEKAMFAHLTTRSKPPKHGVIFNHPLVKTAHPKKRGKVARALAGKIAIAIRSDYFALHSQGSHLADDSLSKTLEKRLKEIQALGPGRKKT